MSERRISYLDRSFEEYRDDLKKMIANNYPDIAKDFDDASIGSWLIDLVASIADNLSYHIDGVYTETNIDTAQQANSLFSIARSNGLKVPGPKGSMVELTFSVVLPVSESNGPDYSLSPIIKRGTRVMAGTGQYFETMYDVDFYEQMNSEGTSDRTVTFITGSGIEGYKISKRVLAVSGQSMIHRESIDNSLDYPFVEITIPKTNIMSIESIIFKTGDNYTNDPKMDEFMIPMEKLVVGDKEQDKTPKTEIYRYFEVDSLSEQYRWGDDVRGLDYTIGERAKTLNYGYHYTEDDHDIYVPVTSITKGMWIPLTQKFITEYDENGYLKITFGAGELPNHNIEFSDATDFSKNQIVRLIKTDSLGKTPIPNTTMFILYRVGGGYGSNVPANTIRTITRLDYDSKFCLTKSDDLERFGKIIKTINVTNESPSVSGKDMPTTEELRYLIKYNNTAMNRCVCLKDYENRILKLPARYGTPFKVAAMEENNKIMIYLLNIDNNGYLTDILPVLLTENISNYLSMYRSINDFVEIKPGRIINLSFEADLFVDKNYDSREVVKDVIEKIKDYMDVSKHNLGDDIFVGDIMKEIGKVDGVLNLIDLRVYNNFSNDSKGEYSMTQTSQATYNDGMSNVDMTQIDLPNSDYVLYSDADEMFEIKYPDRDIRIKIKTR